MKAHFFDVDLATEIGVKNAIMFQNIGYWVELNKANDRNKYGDDYWTYNSVAAFKDIFPYWTDAQIRRILDSLLEKKLIKKGSFNNDRKDRTSWYTLTKKGLAMYEKKAFVETDKSICENEQVHLRKSTNAFVEINKCNIITDNKHTDNKPDNKQKENNTKEKVLWRMSFEEYKRMTEEAKQRLLSDREFKDKMLDWFPNLDYDKTIDKTADWWASVQGWEHNKKKRTDNINLYTAIKNNADRNRVYIPFKTQSIKEKADIMDTQMDLYRKAQQR